MIQPATPTTIFYDLTELLYLSKGFNGHYGIAKVVREGAKSAFKADDGVRFVVYHQGFDSFMEIFPELDNTVEGGVKFNIPNEGLPIFVRQVFAPSRKKMQTLVKALAPIVKLIERTRWKKSGTPFEPVDMSNGLFVSCARPKLMIHPIQALKRFKNTQVHALLHDAIPLHDAVLSGQNFTSSFQSDTSRVIESANQIIANSQFSANDLASFADQKLLPKAKKLTVAQLPHECLEGFEAPEIDLPDRPYVLMVGTSLGRKNLDVVLAAQKRLADQGKEPPLLVLAGRRRKRTMEYLDSPAMVGVKPHVLQIDSPNQTDLVRLYKGCLAVVLASRVEGWGLPVAEALWCGKPAFCADIPVLHEVCGDMGQYFDISDSETVATYLNRISTDADWRAELMSQIAGNRHLLRSWDDFTQTLLNNVKNGM